MKKLYVVILSIILSAGIASAQDLAQITEKFNAAAEVLNAGDKAAALSQFAEVLPLAEALGAEGGDIVSKCKELIPSLYVSVAKALAKSGDNSKAIETLAEAVKAATEYGDAATASEAKNLMESLNFSEIITKAKELTANQDFAGAAAVLEKGLEGASESNAAIINKQLSSTYLRLANAKFKTKDMKGALEFAQKSSASLDNPNAQKIAGHAALALKQFRVAAEAYEAYLAMSPDAKDKVQIMYQAGSAYQSLGDAGKACGYFKEIAQDPKWGEGARYQMTVLKCN